MTPTQEAIIAVLANEDEPITERELGRRVGVDLTVIGKNMKRLQAAGFARCEQRVFARWKYGDPPGQRLAWAIAEPSHDR